MDSAPSVVVAAEERATNALAAMAKTPPRHIVSEILTIWEKLEYSLSLQQFYGGAAVVLVVKRMYEAVMVSE